MSVCNCAVPHCTVRKRRDHPGEVSSFSFPVKDPARCREWVRAIRNPKFSDNTPLIRLKNERVCSLHFRPEEVERDSTVRCRIMGYRRPPAVLSSTAVPSINLDEDSAEPPPAKKSRTEVLFCFE